MAVESIQCPKCGSPLEVESTARFAVCDYCGSRLRITRGASGHPLGVLEDIKVDTEVIAKQTAIDHLKDRLQHFREERDRLQAQLEGELERARSDAAPGSWQARFGMVFLAGFLAFSGLVILRSWSAAGGVLCGGVVLAAAGVYAYFVVRALHQGREYERAKSEIPAKYRPAIARADEQIQSTQ